MNLKEKKSLPIYNLEFRFRITDILFESFDCSALADSQRLRAIELFNPNKELCVGRIVKVKTDLK